MRSTAATVDPAMSFRTPAAEALCSVSVLVHRWSVSSTCIWGLFSRSKARWTLTRALALAASAGKSGTGGDIRSGRAAKRARSESSLRASNSLLSARIRDISPTLQPAGLSRPAPAGHAVQDQEEHQEEGHRQSV
jgi:hypothetical protein